MEGYGGRRNDNAPRTMTLAERAAVDAKGQRGAAPRMYVNKNPSFNNGGSWSSAPANAGGHSVDAQRDTGMMFERSIDVAAHKKRRKSRMREGGMAMSPIADMMSGGDGGDSSGASSSRGGSLDGAETSSAAGTDGEGTEGFASTAEQEPPSTSSLPSSPSSSSLDSLPSDSSSAASAFTPEGNTASSPTDQASTTDTSSSEPLPTLEVAPVKAPVVTKPVIKPLSSLSSLLDESTAGSSSSSTSTESTSTDSAAITNTKDIVLDEGDHQCVAKKRLIIDVNLGSLGNRMLTLISAAHLAVAYDRTLEVDWQQNKACGFSLNELFAPKSVEPYLPRPFIFETELIQREFKHIGSGILATCHTHFENTDVDALYFLKDKELFEKLNAKCDVIYLRSNIYFTSALVDVNVLGDSATKLRAAFPHPFHDIASVVFRVRPEVAEMGDSFINREFRDKKWLAFHGRSYSEGGIQDNYVVLLIPSMCDFLSPPSVL